jgi:NADH-quinone oxidoreductase subunit L
MNRVGEGLPNAVFLFVSFLFSCFLFQQTWFENQNYQIDFEWFTFKDKTIHLKIWIDKVASAMFFVVSFISALVHLFSVSYMKEDKHLGRYFAILGLFTFAMQGLLLTNNLLIIYIFWELVGFCSYLLIGFWYEKPEAAKAAKKAFLFNRVGDMGFLLAIALLWFHFQTLEVDVLISLFSDNKEVVNDLFIIGLGFVLAACGKSAQLPLSVWLPSAMEGPTPVSALIHAATMVAAGVYLLIRVHFLFVPNVQLIITIIGTLTALLSAFSALSQTDIKKVFAYSTVSQLGFMMVAIGVNAPQVALFHLLTHAFFKAGLFLSVGAVIHALHEQDMTKMGNLRKKMPLVFIAYSAFAFSLAGVPLFSGFLSKEAILTSVAAWAEGNPLGWWILFSLLLTVLLTAFYISRQWSLVFLRVKQGSLLENQDLIHSDFKINFPLVLLAICSLFFAFSWNPFHADSSWFSVGLGLKNIYISVWLSITSIFLATLGLFGGWCVYACEDVQKFQLTRLIFNSTLYQLSYNFFFLDGFYKRFFQALYPHTKQISWDKFYERSIIRGAVWFAGLLADFDRRTIDKAVNVVGVDLVGLGVFVAWLDRHIVDGFTRFWAFLLGLMGRKIKSMQGGKVQSYFAWAIVLLILLCLLFWILVD